MYRIQVNTSNGWRDLRTSDGYVYEYPDEDSAKRMLEICYPDQCREARLGAEPIVRVYKVDP